MMIAKSPDFIIPFLVNQSTEGITRTDSSIQKKRYSVPNKGKEFNGNSSMELVKVYKPSKKRWDKPQKIPQKHLQKKPKIEVTQRLTEDSAEKGHSQLEINLQKSPYISRNRFFKAQSLINHIPVYNYSQQPMMAKYSPQKVEKSSPIPGVRFKKKMILNQSANLIAPSAPDEDYKSQFAGKIKNWREKKEWNRKRSSNVDFIVNRKCKNFTDLISEYCKRLGLPQRTKIYIFNSKDTWLRRVLNERGWVQNLNKQSRAFHLYWSSRIYKENVFPEQIVNHYQSSDLLTSKAGLHSMLLKYGLTYLQPATFDLSLQTNQFIVYFTKLYFLGRLRKLIGKFQFQEGPACRNFQEFCNKFMILKNRQMMNGFIEADLIGLIESCLSLLEGRLQELTASYLDKVIFSTHSLLKLTSQEEDLVRLLRDFEFLCRKNKTFSAEIASGLDNVWLTKSKTSSKGVGISIHKDLDSILKHDNRLAQKYIENPLIFFDPTIKGRKFDIRVWVLLVGNLRAKLFYHQKFYGRLCFEPYSLDTITLDNQKKHLTNYSQNKLSFRDDSLSNSIILPEEIFSLIDKQKGIDFRSTFYEKLQMMLSKMGVIFRNEVANGNSSSFQLFGLDLLIDSNLSLHLLEINLSAACQERHEGLSSMMEDVAHGMINILEGGSQLRGWKAVK